MNDVDFDSDDPDWLIWREANEHRDRAYDEEDYAQLAQEAATSAGRDRV